jgi:hypothetical protein
MDKIKPNIKAFYKFIFHNYKLIGKLLVIFLKLTWAKCHTPEEQ